MSPITTLIGRGVVRTVAEGDASTMKYHVKAGICPLSQGPIFKSYGLEPYISFGQIL